MFLSAREGAKSFEMQMKGEDKCKVADGGCCKTHGGVLIRAFQYIFILKF